MPGTVVYVTLMTTGTLIVAMVLHAMWDFGTLGILATDRQQRPVAGLLALASLAVGIVSVWFVVTG